MKDPVPQALESRLETVSRSPEAPLSPRYCIEPAMWSLRLFLIPPNKIVAVEGLMLPGPNRALVRWRGVMYYKADGLSRSFCVFLRLSVRVCSRLWGMIRAGG